MGLSPAVWLELLLILAAVPLVILGGAWILRSVVDSRRRAGLARSAEEGSVAYELTVAVERVESGSFSAHYDADDDTGYPPPRDPPPARTLGGLREVVDASLIAWYRVKSLPIPVLVDFSMYPWVEGQIPPDLAQQVGTDWLVFVVNDADGKFSAMNHETGLIAEADSLDGLADAVRSAIAARWPSLAPEVPGMLTWKRALTEAGFAPARGA
jgi:hypothetical protein